MKIVTMCILYVCIYNYYIILCVRSFIVDVRPILIWKDIMSLHFKYLLGALHVIGIDEVNAIQTVCGMVPG